MTAVGNSPGHNYLTITVPSDSLCLMKISIITVSYNSATTIEDTILSVAGQTHPDTEHLLIDGASTDGTVVVADRHRSALAVIRSEPDHGIYDAMNKGIALATGEVLAFLNADDVYSDNQVLARVAEVFADPTVDACYADLLYVDRADLHRIVRYWKSCPYHPGLFERGWCPPHPTFFVRKRVFDSLGAFDLNFTLAADAELMMRFLAVHQVFSRYLPVTMVKMRLGGATNRNLANVVKQNREIMSALKQHGIQTSWPGFLAHKLWARGKQFFAGLKA